ncbi:MAG: hypothetical protein FJZ87_12095 [Chloroflexi bacterium]|nr:hypothetical protein [Chloroflexota bacterium]
MNCPECKTELVKKYYKGMIEVETCPRCRGMWLDLVELDQLEDTAFDEDAQKGSLFHYQRRGDRLCPHCGLPMDEFQYRLFDLHLNYCAVHEHGFWLDAGEDERVTSLMTRRARDIHRKEEAESEWKQVLRNMHAFLRKRDGS